MNKIQLIGYLQKHVTDVKLRELFDTLSADKIVRLVFFDPNLDHTGLRLAPTGLKMVKNCFKTYDVTVEDGQILTTKDILWLHRNIATPYYIAAKRIRETVPNGRAVISTLTVITMTDEIDAAMLTLAGGKIPH